MQPKTEEPANAKEPTPIEQWDAVAFKLIQQELAPKGYSEIKRGPWRGKVQSNIPFLPKTSVLNCQKIAAQMVRTFKGKVEREITDAAITSELQVKRYKEILDGCGLLQFKKKAECRASIQEHETRHKFAKAMLQRINNLGIK